MNRGIKIIVYLFVSMLFCASGKMTAQTLDSAEYREFSFINTSLNIITKDSSLAFFYEKLHQLEQTKGGRVNIVHIGDSHLQADNLSGQVRQKIQLRFGNAGRGLVFPYRAAKSNEPASYRTSTNVKWEYKRNVFPDKPLPIGICGYTIETKDTLAEITVAVKDQHGLGYGTTRFTLFYEKTRSNFDLNLLDDFNCEIGMFRTTDKSTNPFVSELKFEKPFHNMILRSECYDTAVQKSARIYGMLMENDSAGVLYNMIGVNGAEYKHYNASQYFIQQLSYLNPDLVIISLGTNEAYTAGFDKDVFLKSVDSLVNNLRQMNPHGAILLVSPPDSYRRSKNGRVKNPDMKIARSAIVEYCRLNQLPCWDLYEIMGGYGSMGKWYVAKLSAADRIHFSGKGYQIQGDLLYNALMKGYERYIQSKEKK